MNDYAVTLSCTALATGKEVGDRSIRVSAPSAVHAPYEALAIVEAWEHTGFEYAVTKVVRL